MFAAINSMAQPSCIVVEIKQVEPGVDVLAVRIELVHLISEVGDGFMVAVRRAT
jgi:hypothetical protein